MTTESLTERPRPAPIWPKSPPRLVSQPLWLLVALALASPWILAAGGTEAPVLWWAARAFGFVSYVALWIAMLTGVLIGAKGIEGVIDRKVLFELHQQWTLSGVAATAVHVLAVVTNAHAGVGVVGALVPFASSTMTGAVGLGVVAFWAFTVVAASSWVRTRLSYGVWRGIHALAFGAFLLALVHSVASGTDSGAPLVQWLYVASGSLLAGAIATRLVIALAGRRHATAA
jgi:sulfoxide reductase heme-binding subunit YedZ